MFREHSCPQATGDVVSFVPVGNRRPNLGRTGVVRDRSPVLWIAQSRCSSNRASLAESCRRRSFACEEYDPRDPVGRKVELRPEPGQLRTTNGGLAGCRTPQREMDAARPVGGTSCLTSTQVAVAINVIGKWSIDLIPPVYESAWPSTNAYSGIRRCHSRTATRSS